jgi:hypothetical protein
MAEGNDALERERSKMTCVDYRPLPGKVRCQHFVDGGTCARPDYFLCVEWLKANPHRDARGPELPLPPERDSYAELARRAERRAEQAERGPARERERPSRPGGRSRADEEPRYPAHPPDEPSRARGHSAPLYRLDRRPIEDIDGRGERPLIDHPELLSVQAIADITATGLEVDVQFRDRLVTLVPAYTDRRGERAELSYHDARAIAVLAQALSPTATLVAIRPPPCHDGASAGETAAARASESERQKGA